MALVNNKKLSIQITDTAINILIGNKNKIYETHTIDLKNGICRDGNVRDKDYIIKVLNDYLDIELESEVADTIGGFFIEKLGEIPTTTKNCEVSSDNITLRLVKLDDRRIDRIHLIINNKDKKTEELYEE